MAHVPYLKLLAETAVKEAGLPAGVAEDIALKFEKLPDADLPDAIKEEIAQRIEANPKIVTPEIDEALEAKAKAGNMTALGALSRAYEKSPGFLEERQAAWEAEKVGNDRETVKRATKIVDEERANSPWNPRKHYPNDAARQRDIAKYIGRFGTKSAANAAAFFGVDIAGRVIGKKRA